jgi:hypothetical protein
MGDTNKQQKGSSSSKTMHREKQRKENAKKKGTKPK